CFLITASRPPSMLPAEFVGLTQALTGWSSIDPWAIFTSGVSSKGAPQAATIFGLTSPSTTLTNMAPPSESKDEFHPRFQPLLLGVVDDVLVVGELRGDPRLVADAVATVEAVRRGVQAVGNLGVFLDLAQGHPGDAEEARAVLAGGGVKRAGAGGVAEIDAV